MAKLASDSKEAQARMKVVDKARVLLTADPGMDTDEALAQAELMVFPDRPKEEARRELQREVQARRAQSIHRATNREAPEGNTEEDRDKGLVNKLKARRKEIEAGAVPQVD